MRKQRTKKLFNGEKCGICTRPAQGIKYNAISCDSCRVFFRRLVLMRDNCHRSNQPFTLPCMKAHIERKSPNLTTIDVMLKCQHCRFQACIDAGMKEEYVQGSVAFGDNRTSRKNRHGSRSPKEGSASPEQCHSSTMEVTVTPIDSLTSQRDDLLGLLSVFWGRYVRQSSDARAVLGEHAAPVEKWMVPSDSVTKLRCIEHIKHALNLHVHRLSELIDVLPMTRLMFTDQQKHSLVMKSYMEVIVLRWVVATDSNRQSIRGVTGIDYKWSDMCEFGSSWTKKFQEYFDVASNIKRAKPDDKDLALMTALITLSADRHDDLSPSQRAMITNLQEFAGAILWEKCKRENNRRKFYVLMNELISLRTTIREVDVSQVQGYSRRIILTDDVTITV